MIICHWAILHYNNMSFKTMQEGLMVFSEDFLHFLKIKKKKKSNSPKLSCGFKGILIAMQLQLTGRNPVRETRSWRTPLREAVWGCVRLSASWGLFSLCIVNYRKKNQNCLKNKAIMMFLNIHICPLSMHQFIEISIVRLCLNVFFVRTHR